MGCCGKVDDAVQPEPKPLSKRFCTDLLCLIIFIAFVGLQMGIMVFGFTVGDWASLLYEQDYLGNRCGVGAFADRPKAFYPRIPLDMLEEENRAAVEAQDFMKLNLYALCVDECPQTFNIQDPENAMKLDYGFDTTSAVTQALGAGTQEYWLSATPTLDIMNRCIPRAETSEDEQVMCAYPNCNSTDVINAGGVCANTPEFPNGEWSICPAESGSGVPTSDLKCAMQKDVCKVKATLSTGMAYEVNANDEASAALLGSVSALVGGVYEIIVAIYDARTYIALGGILLPIVLAFAYMLLLFLFAKTIIYGLLIATIVVELIATFVMFAKSGVEFQSVSGAALLEMASETANMSTPDAASEILAVVDEDSQWMYSAAFLFFAVLTVLTILLVITSRKKIRICAAIIKEATTVFATMPTLMLFPTWATIVQIGVCAWFFGTLMLIYTTKPESIDTALGLVANTSYLEDVMGVLPTELQALNVDPIAALRVYSEDEQFIFYLTWVVLFGFLVFIQFVQGVSWCTMSASVYFWYFFRTNDKEKTRIPIIRSLGRTLFYHTGSVAFAAFVIAICDMIRAIAYYVEKQMEAASGGKPSQMVKLAFKALHCCLGCLKKTVKFVSYYGLVWVACQGTSFCAGCFKTFFFFLQNPGQVSINALVTMLLSLLALFSMPLFCGVAFYYLLDTVLATEHASYPAAIITVCAMLMTKACMTVFECTITTIFVCCFQDKAEFSARFMNKEHPRLARAFGIKKEDDKEEGKEAEAKKEGDEKLQTL